MLHTCCFVGHRKIRNTDELRKKLYNVIEKLIEEDVCTFLFGSKSEFNDLCYSVVTDLKLKYPNIKRVYVRAEFPEINEEYQKYLFQFYEETYYPSVIKNSGKAVYVERNYIMIDKSKYCVVYYDKSYVPKNLRKGGTEIAYKFALSKNRTVINVFE